jgi:HEAT repeat protein
VSDKEQFNRSENHPGNPVWTCTDVAPLLLFYVCEELTDFEHAAVEEHLAGCANCAAAFVREKKLQEFVTSHVQPSEQLDPGGLLLAQCRSELEEALDDWEAAEKNSRRFPVSLRGLHPLAWLSRQFVAHPAFGTALLVFSGAVFGVMAPQWYESYVSRAARAEVPVMKVSAPQRLSEQDLANMDLAGINLTPAPNGTGAGTVEMRFTAAKPVVFEGSLDDSEVRRLLTSMIQNSQKYDEGVRLDCLDALRTHSGDRDVRKTLCLAARRDRNPAVRLRALEALQGSAADQAVRETLLEAVLNDTNPGVRVEAINALVSALEQRQEAEAGSDMQHVESVLQDLVRKDPNHYVRIQSASALRHLRPRGTP